MPTEYIEITDKVEYGDVDADMLPLHKCVCGIKFPYWEFILNDHVSELQECPNCGRKMFFKHLISVIEVKED
jgi:DNA-directed RNA polymerase subunit RPC12/RpoP